MTSFLFPPDSQMNFIQNVLETDAKIPYNMARRGYAYERGIAGVEKDWNKALEWYQKAADAGDGYSMFIIGSLYIEDDMKDIDKALFYLREAAMNGCQSYCSKECWEIFQKAGEISFDALAKND